MAGRPRVLLLDAGGNHDIFEVEDVVDGVIRVRSPFLFEVGEELRVRLEEDGAVSEATTRVRGHVGAGDDKVTELEVTEQTEARTVVSG